MHYWIGEGQRQVFDEDTFYEKTVDFDYLHLFDYFDYFNVYNLQFGEAADEWVLFDFSAEFVDCDGYQYECWV